LALLPVTRSLSTLTDDIIAGIDMDEFRFVLAAQSMRDIGGNRPSTFGSVNDILIVLNRLCWR
jgi:hypothetical protein